MTASPIRRMGTSVEDGWRESSRPGLLATWIQHPRAAHCVALEAGQIGRMVSVQPFLLPLARGRDWSGLVCSEIIRVKVSGTG